ncbi:MAG TPA: hypothetical protein VJT31_13685 [Rugosimonospora sp.]|nr:hypothetical protein [Rugosimonospora sp.]
MYPVPQPGPAPQPQGTAGPPISPVQTPAGTGYPVPPPPARPARFGLVALIVVTALLAAALPVTAGLGWSTIGRLRHQVTTRRDTRNTLADQAAAAAAKQRDDFHSAGFDAKLQHIKDLDKAVDQALTDWHNGTIRYGVLAKAVEDCDDAVDDYDRTAAPFPDSLFGGLPQRINLNNPETDCGRAFVNQI